MSKAVIEGLGGDYHDTKFTNFVGGQWNKVEYVFYSGDNTDLRMFISYDSAASSGNEFFYMDEFTVFKAPDQEAVATYKATVSAENGYAYSMVNGYVPYDTEVSVIATPFGGYTFDGWYENGVKVSSDNIYTFKIQANRNLVAKCVPTTTSTPYIPDIDSNGNADLKDLVLLARYVAEWDVVINETVADVDSSGEVNLDDVKLLAKYCAKWDVEEKMPSEIITDALPEEDLTSDDLKATLLAGESEYYNKSTVINEGNKARIAKVLKKAQNGEDITVVGFGGSITEGAGTSSANDQYCARVAEWFRQKFPNITVNYINAGIGSTTSLVGVHRMDKQVLEFNPDLVIVDFTTNDISDIRHSTSYEAVIRRLLEEDIAVISVIFGCVSNYDVNNGEGKNIRQENTLGFHLPSTLYYDIPTIDYFGSLWRYIDAGVIKWTDVGYDYIHPNATGHLVAASAINYYLSTVLNNLDNIDTTVPEIPTERLFDSAIYDTATFIRADEFTPTVNTNFVADYVHGTKIPKGWVCTSDKGGSLKLELKGVTSVTLFLQYKSGYNGKGEVLLNGKKVISDAFGSGSNTSGMIWFAHQERYDEPTDVVLTLTCNGNFGLAPIGVTYANN